MRVPSGPTEYTIQNRISVKHSLWGKSTPTRNKINFNSTGGKDILNINLPSIIQIILPKIHILSTKRTHEILSLIHQLVTVSMVLLNVSHNRRWIGQNCHVERDEEVEWLCAVARVEKVCCCTVC